MALQQLSSVFNISAAEEGQQSFRFLDLPPEIRNLIYDELLPLGRTVLVDHSVFRGYVKTEPRCNTFTRLVTTNKQTHSEAVAKLYGDLAYSFSNAYALTEWLHVIGTMKQHLRHIQLKPCMLWHWGSELTCSTLEQFRQAKDLQVVEFKIDCAFGTWVRCYPAKMVADDLEPLMRAMMEANGGHNSRQKALRVLSVSADTVWMERFQENERARVAAYEVAVKAELIKLLG
ncbi:hypothetical protein LTR37_007035 [Vermiconidia calcicola]|uniref:Uncharacterized protein n=1 Tax=Vermiconidia calcicola TaxID=1690605 RepID=A0ACC3NFR4_9PEZI|nr:hypothetical protein LTR37_007035 [Vermiconidia calcicola]